MFFLSIEIAVFHIRLLVHHHVMIGRLRPIMDALGLDRVIRLVLSDDTTSSQSI